MGDNSYRAAWVSDDVAMFQEMARRFFESEFAQHQAKWRANGQIDRSLWRMAGEMGMLAASMPEEFGGGGNKAFMAAVLLEQGRIGDASWGVSVQNYVMHYILAYGTETQRAQWLPKMASGEFIGAIAMTEPNAGSDLKQLSTTARRQGESYVINGQKIFITNGQVCDLVCVAARTGNTGTVRDISLVVVETKNAAGFRRGSPLKKIGLHAADTSELFFDDVAVPAENVLGGLEGKGFAQLMTELPWERLSIAIRCVGMAEFTMNHTIEHVRQRKAFGGTLFDLQNTQFKLADCKTQLEAMRALVDSSISRLLAGQFDIAAAAATKLFCSEAINHIVDECVQLHGGYGFMEEYPVARMYDDARAQRIYGGSSEVMKMLIARGLP